PLGCVLSKRFASTDHPPPPIVNSPPPIVNSPPSIVNSPPPNVNPPPVAVAEPVHAPSDEFVSSSLDSITGLEYPRIAEHVGYLKDLGLDFGWGPTAMLQTFLEYVHIYSGADWGGAIIISACIIRLALLKTFLNASDTQARVAVLAPHINPLKAQLKQARATRDIDQVRNISMDLKQLYTAGGVQLWRLFVPLVQIPIGFGTFRLMRGMAELPVPGLDSAGLLWLTDLSESDPYYILPIFTGLAFHLTFKHGGDLGSNPLQSPGMKKTLIYVVPAITTIFNLFWPGTLQLSFACTSFFSLVQSYSLRQPGVRRFFNIQPLPDSNNDTPSPSPDATPGYEDPSKPPVNRGFIGGAVAEVKGAASQVIKTAQNLRENPEDELKGSGRRSPADAKRAKAYEDRRRKELAEEKVSAKRRT
ncbi:Mitochondrial inner membrane protein oxa1, partial [Pseudocyphellaria aurata]|nr:Mitochondrial inner membrane protein oxa1 [Pseudocyphellaria aurata]